MKKKNNNKTDLAVIDGHEFTILKAGIDGLKQSLQENIGDEGLSPFDLDRVKIPAGDTKAWTIPGIGEDEIVPSFNGVIIYQKTGRVFWKIAFEDGGVGSPPDCSSDDGKTGIGNPGGPCAQCPFAEFGSAKSGNGKGQACKQIKMLFVMRSEGLLPICVSLPPTSLRPTKKYMLRLASFSQPYFTVLTKFELEEATNAEGIKYCRAKLSIAQKLNPQQAEQFKKLSYELRPSLDQVPVKSSDLPEYEDKN